MCIAAVILTILRIIGFAFTLFAPLPGFLVSYFLDFFDGGFYYYLGGGLALYEAIDKPLDLLQFIILIPLMKKSGSYKLYLFLLLWRAIGLVIFYLTNQRAVFIIFPNFIEFLTFSYILFSFVRKLSPTNEFIAFFHTFQWNDKRIFLGAFLLKIGQELMLHLPNGADRTFWLWENIQKLSQ